MSLPYSARTGGQTTAAIVELGALTRALAQRYEQLFEDFRKEASGRAEEAPTLVDAARAVIDLLAEVSSAHDEHFPNADAIDCAEGCSACCHLAVATPPGVGSLIGAYIDEHFTAQDRAALVVRLHVAATAGASAGDPHTTRQRCPLLGVDDRCTVYPVRPISCRAFTSPCRTLCRSFVFEGEPASGVAQQPASFRFHKEATAVLQRTAMNRGMAPAQRMLAPALLEALGAGDVAGTAS